MTSTAHIPSRVRSHGERLMTEMDRLQTVSRDTAAALGRQEASHRNREWHDRERDDVAASIRSLRAMIRQHGMDAAAACSEMRDPVAHQLACGGPE